MKYLDEYRDGRIAWALAAEITSVATKPWVLMEICGGQTHTIMRYGLDELLPSKIELVHGPGCPVCVTPLETIDKAIALALRPDVTLVSYGDMLRVPGSNSDLFRAKAQGADVRIAYSPVEAVKIAQANPNRKIVFLAIGFETTAPANAVAAWQAKRDGLPNFSMLGRWFAISLFQLWLVDSSPWTCWKPFSCSQSNWSVAKRASRTNTFAR